MAAVGAVPVTPVRPLAGGAVGAWEVVRPSGASSVLTWRGPRVGQDASAEAARTADLVAIARHTGLPAPAYEDIVALLDGGVVVLQGFVSGVRPRACAEVIDSLLEF